MEQMVVGPFGEAVEARRSFLEFAGDSSFAGLVSFKRVVKRIE